MLHKQAPGHTPVSIMVAPAAERIKTAVPARPAYTPGMQAAGKTEPIVIVYNAECAFCRARMHAVRKWDLDGRCEYIAAQDPDLPDRFPQLQGTDLADGLRVVLPDGQVRFGADAVHAIAQRLPAVRWLSPLYRLPGVGTLSRRAYAWIAANRHALSRSCQTGSCRL